MATQYGFHVDSEKCIKCWACEIACKQWSGIKAGGAARRKVHEFTEGEFPQVKRTFVSIACLQCADAPCAKACSTKALTKQEDTGIMTVDKTKCTGCKACLEACPFDIPDYSDNVAEICDCCLGAGVEAGASPHCVTACPTKALTYGIASDKVKAEGGKTAQELLSLPLQEENPAYDELVTEATVMKTPDDLTSNEEGSGTKAVDSNGC